MRQVEIEKILKYKKLCIYGIGNQFKEEYKVIRDKPLVLFDGDSSKWGQFFDGNVIHNPKEISEYLDDNTAVMIGCVNNQYEIAKYLTESLNVCERNLFMYTSPWYEKNIYKDNVVEDNLEKINECCDKLADDYSREYYQSALAARRSRNPLLLLPNLNCVNAGEYGDIVTLSSGDHIIDCGAYTGDTAEVYLKRLNMDCKVFAIEPFEQNYRLLKQRIEKNEWEERIIPLMFALGREVKEAEISYDNDDFGMAINLSEKKGRQIQKIYVNTLDNMFKTEKITYIKMDIEGEERDALEGARNLIKRNHPKLMISAYHRIEDFWELPEKIWSIDSNYKIYAGHMQGVSTEMEFYCI